MTTGLEFRCEQCGATLHFPAGQRTQTCPWCASPHVVEGALAGPAAAEPQFIIPHSQGEARARAELAAWQRSLGFFRHPGVRRARLEDFRGVYLPGLVYSAVARASYAASIAEEYYVTETYTVTVNGKTQTRTRRVKKHEWIPLRGEFDAYVTDVVVSASKGLPNDELERVEPFDFRELRRYVPALVAGWPVEAPSSPLDTCLAAARQETGALVTRRLEGFMPGEMHADLKHQTRLEDETGALTLFPVWVLALRFAEDEPPLRVVINGQTGRVGARVPWSRPRIVAALLFALALLGGLAWFLSQR